MPLKYWKAGNPLGLVWIVATRKVAASEFLSCGLPHWRHVPHAPSGLWAANVASFTCEPSGGIVFGDASAWVRCPFVPLAGLAMPRR